MMPSLTGHWTVLGFGLAVTLTSILAAAGCEPGSPGQSFIVVGPEANGTGRDSGTSDTTDGGGNSGTQMAMKAPWDWNGVVGTGQSLAVGTTPVTSTTQPYHNLKLSLQGATVPPWDATQEALSMVPLVEPIRPMTSGYPRPYPDNVWGETPHSAMANQISSLVLAGPGGDYVSVHTVVGESGQGMVALKKQTGDTTGTTGRAYEATLFEAGAIARLARDAGKTYGIAAIVMTHGETDSGSSTYKDELIQLLNDYNADLAQITGQELRIPMYVSQQFAYPSGAGQRPSIQVQWQLGVEHPGDFVCTGPKYQYPGYGDGVHLAAAGHQQLGEKLGQIYFERVVLGKDWQPLQPTSVERSGNVITVHFHVPVPPLDWDASLPDPPTWANGRGFEVRAGSTKIEITSVEISGDGVQITCSSDLPTSGLVVGYAMTSAGTQMSNASNAYRWGQLRDSDPFVGSTTGVPQPNYCIAFEMPVP